MRGPRTPAPVVVGYDGSEEARAAVLWALRESEPNSEIVLVAALGHESARLPLARLAPGLPGEHSRHLDRVVHAWAEEFDALEGLAELRLHRGEPAAVIAREAAERGAAMIVVGHHRERRLEGARASVARDLLDRAPCPVVIVG